MGYGEWIKMPDGTAVHVYYGGKRPTPPPKCVFCDRQSTRLCDFVVSPPQQVTHKRTCDAPMCDEHAHRVGHNKDYCPRHAKQGELFKTKSPAAAARNNPSSLGHVHRDPQPPGDERRK